MSVSGAQPLTTADQPATPPASTRTEPLAIAALVSAFFMPVAAIALGHVALSRLQRSGEQGRGLAIAGLVIGYSTIALLAAFVVASIGILITVAALPTGFPAP